jgi:acyl carrier protein
MTQTTEQRVARVIADCTATDIQRIVPTARLTADLDLDSLDQAEILMGLEDEFIIAIPDDAAPVTVAEVVAAVEALLGEAA